MSGPLLTVSGLAKRYRRGGKTIAAVEDVSFAIEPGETLALAGPSGSGKSTIARLVLRLIEPDAGRIQFEGDDFLALTGAALRARRARLQMVFQDPLAAFNPRATVARVLDDPLRIHGIASRAERPAPYRRLAGARRPECRSCAPRHPRNLRRPAPARGHCPRHRHETRR